MKFPIETIRLSQKAKDQLVQIKKATGIENWNTLCRIAFCLSLKDVHEPPELPENNEVSTIEMTWKTFGSDQELIYASLLRLRIHQKKIKMSGKNYFRIHLERGITLLLNSDYNEFGSIY